MSQLNARAALAQAFVGGSFFAAQDVAWENVSFTPRSGTPWAKWTFMPSSLVADTLGETGLDMLEGFVQIDLNYATGTGDGDAMSKYLALAALFKAGAKFSYGSQVVVIRACSRSHGRVFDSYYRVTVTIFFYAQIQR